MQEQRRFPRIQEKLPFKILCQSKAIITQTKNISCSGVYCAIDENIPQMTKVRITMTVPVEKNNKISGKNITCEGIVVRADSPEDLFPQIKQNAAIMFTEISDTDKQIIANYVNNQIAKFKEGLG